MTHRSDRLDELRIEIGHTIMADLRARFPDGERCTVEQLQAAALESAASLGCTLSPVVTYDAATNDVTVIITLPAPPS